MSYGTWVVPMYHVTVKEIVANFVETMHRCQWVAMFFCCGKVFFCAFFPQKFFIKISGFLRSSLINFPQNLVLLLRGQ